MDKTIKVRWPKVKFKISKKDKNLGTFKDFLKNHKSL